MSDKFQDIYRIPSARAEWWDYGNNAAYFVTICTGGREHYFGEIQNDIMYLSEMGKIAHQNWMEIPDHFSFIKLDVFVIMPNHIHGILVIDKTNDPGRDAIDRVSDTNPNWDSVKSDEANQLDDVKSDASNQSDAANQSDAINQSDAANQSDAINRVSTENKYPGGITGKNNPMLFDNLSRAIRWYKGKTSFYCHKIHSDFTWQSRFHDHIIRDENEYWKIRQYILNNPKRWSEDKYNQPETHFKISDFLD